jgi:hypothetical protein
MGKLFPTLGKSFFYFSAKQKSFSNHLPIGSFYRQIDSIERMRNSIAGASINFVLYQNERAEY